ncbi:Recombination enhancement, RecA-dependent nuclease [compost metagenome]
MNKTERQHLNKVAALGCIACYQQGTPGTPAEIHHPRAGTGAGRRASHFDAIGLCPMHHRGTAGLSVPSIHGSKNAFIEAFGTEADLLELTKTLI